jgi:hypothetical protein
MEESMENMADVFTNNSNFMNNDITVRLMKSGGITISFCDVFGDAELLIVLSKSEARQIFKKLKLIFDAKTGVSK